MATHTTPQIVVSVLDPNELARFTPGKDDAHNFVSCILNSTLGPFATEDEANAAIDAIQATDGKGRWVFCIEELRP